MHMLCIYIYIYIPIRYALYTCNGSLQVAGLGHNARRASLKPGGLARQDASIQPDPSTQAAASPSDTTIYEPDIQALLGTAPHFCSAVDVRLSGRPYALSSTRWPTTISSKSTSSTRQCFGGGKLIQKRLRRRSPLLKTTGFRGKSTFGDPLLDSVVVMSTPHLLTLDWAAAVAPGYMTLGK